jgi:hypothetical protein
MLEYRASCIYFNLITHTFHSELANAVPTQCCLCIMGKIIGTPSSGGEDLMALCTKIPNPELGT